MLSAMAHMGLRPGTALISKGLRQIRGLECCSMCTSRDSPDFKGMKTLPSPKRHGAMALVGRTGHNLSQSGL